MLPSTHLCHPLRRAQTCSIRKILGPARCFRQAPGEWGGASCPHPLPFNDLPNQESRATLTPKGRGCHGAAPPRFARLFLEKKHLWWPQPQGSLRTSTFLSSFPLPPGHLDTARMWSLHGAHEHNEKEGSQRKKWRLTAAGRLSVFISNLMEFPTGGSFFFLANPLSCSPTPQ